MLITKGTHQHVKLDERHAVNGPFQVSQWQKVPGRVDHDASMRKPVERVANVKMVGKGARHHASRLTEADLVQSRAGGRPIYPRTHFQSRWAAELETRQG